MGEWQEIELGALMSEKGYIRGPFGSALRRGEMKETGIPVYEQKNAIYNERNFRFFIDEEKFEELKRFQVKTNDLIISCSGTVGKISIIRRDDPKGIISQALLILRPDVEKIDLMFLYYFLTSQQGYHQITQASHGSVQVNIAARKIVEQIPVPTPELSEQKAIAEVLSSLDDKIDLLHRQNQTLEALAETLFRHTFIDNAQDDWEDGTLGDIISISSGKGLKRAEYVDNGPYPVLGANGKIGLTDKYLFDETLIFTGRVGTLGNIFISYGKAWYSDNTLLIRPEHSRLFYFTYFLLKSSNLAGYNVGSTQPLIRQSDIKQIEILLPPEQALDEFTKTTKPLLSKLNKNLLQIKTLETLRDTLLPKLMSGNIRVQYDEAD